MKREISKEVFILLIVLVVLLIFLMSLFGNDFLLLIILFLSLFIYLMFFIHRENFLGKKDLKENLRIKDTKKIRIDFWK